MKYEDYRKMKDEEEAEKAFPVEDMVNSPAHYSNNPHGIECIKAIEASMSSGEFKGYLKGNLMKYVWRYTYKKNPLEDLKKAEYYLKALIERVEKDV